VVLAANYFRPPVPTRLFIVLGVALAALGLAIGLRFELRLAVDVGHVLAAALPREEGAGKREPNAIAVTYTSNADDEIPADLYLSSDSSAGPALILLNGVEVTGRRHSIIISLAEVLAVAGFVVLAPEQLGNAEYRLVERDPDALVAGFEFLSARPEVDPDRIGFFGVSTGGSLALVAAADPRIAGDVAFVATLGSYYSLATLLQAATTGTILEDGELRHYEPHPYVWGVARNTLVTQLPDIEDQRALYQLFPGSTPEPNQATLADTDLDSLSGAGRAVFELFANRDPVLAPYLIRRVEVHLPTSLDALSPLAAAEGIQTYVRMLHDRSDPYIPRSESERLLRRLGNSQAQVIETDVLEHALIDEIDLSPEALIGTFAPGMWELFRFAFVTLHGL